MNFMFNKHLLFLWFLHTIVQSTVIMLELEIIGVVSWMFRCWYLTWSVVQSSHRDPKIEDMLPIVHQVFFCLKESQGKKKLMQLTFSFFTVQNIKEDHFIGFTWCYTSDTGIMGRSYSFVSSEMYLGNQWCLTAGGEFVDDVLEGLTIKQCCKH